MIVRTLVLVLAAACAGCSDERAPTGPSDQPLPLTPGLYSLLLDGNPFTCNDLGIPQTGTSVQALASARQSGHEWIFTPANESSGDFELRLTSGGTAATPGAMAVSGTARGQVRHSYGATPGLPAQRATFSTLTVNGELRDNAASVRGRFNGQVLFGRENFVAVCPPGQVAFVLEPIDG